MKIQVKNLKPNPFRDIKNYPIDKNKVQSLINSINETGFWDNIVARKVGGGFQIAYGHHRLLAVEKALGLDAIINIPIKNLNDETMIRIMAEENHDYYSTDVGVVDETIRQVYEFLKATYELIHMLHKRKDGMGGQKYQVFSGLPEPKHHRDDPKNGFHHSVISKQVADWLGKNWHERRVNKALTRMRLYESNKLSKKAVKSMPNVTTAESFTSVVTKHELPKEKQEVVAKRIIETERTGKKDIEYEVLVEKHDFNRQKQEEKRFEDFIGECSGDTRKVTKKINTLVEFKEDFDSKFYKDSFERPFFENAVDLLLISLTRLLGKQRIINFINKLEEKDEKEGTETVKEIPESL